MKMAELRLGPKRHEDGRALPRPHGMKMAELCLSLFKNAQNQMDEIRRGVRLAELPQLLAHRGP